MGGSGIHFDVWGGFVGVRSGLMLGSKKSQNLPWLRCSVETPKTSFWSFWW